ncbi:MAG: hypothetical protein E6Q98_00245 [Rhodospirillaceae bacterium]|nr:MAG: hypothetical protein E6Q98_00245 [Rhodospirillaceae bacterium]
MVLDGIALRVSHHQGRIDWRKLPVQGVGLAYIKATEGGDHRDSRFAANWFAARDAGIKRGAYHFFTLCRSGADQAANFIASVPVEADALPPAVDLEDGGNWASRISPGALQAELAAFIERVEIHYRKPVALYLTEEFDRDFAVSRGFDRPLWLRSLVVEPHFGGEALAGLAGFQLSPARRHRRPGRLECPQVKSRCVTLARHPVRITPRRSHSNARRRHDAGCARPGRRARSANGRP